MFPTTLLRPIYVIITAVVAVGGFLTAALVSDQFEMSLDTTTPVVTINEPVAVAVNVRSDAPTNVFSGIVKFDPAYLTVSSIDYNTSIADIWAVEPWFSQGAGTVSYAGGTTKVGGYTGTDTLLSITFEPVQTGETNISIEDVTILRHDGLGTEVTETTPLDLLFTIEPAILESETVFNNPIAGPKLQILNTSPDTDLNGDGKQSTADLSIFMLHLTTQNLRSDFDGNGVVSLRDLSILTRY